MNKRVSWDRMVSRDFCDDEMLCIVNHLTPNGPLSIKTSERCISFEYRSLSHLEIPSRYFGQYQNQSRTVRYYVWNQRKKNEIANEGLPLRLVVLRDSRESHNRLSMSI